MATSLKLSNSLYLECVSLTQSSSANTQYTIVSANTNFDRRIYGISVASTDANTQGGANIPKVYVSDGVNSYQVSAKTITANYGNTIANGPVDILGDPNALPIFNKRCDVTGVYYFNLPKNWSIKFSYVTTLDLSTDSLVFTSFGEIYDSNVIRHTSNSFEQSATFSTATGTTETTLLSSSQFDRRIYGISAASTDGTSRTMAIKLRYGNISYLAYTISILANSGNTTTITPTDIFYNALTIGLFVKLYEPDGTYYFNLPSGWSITGTLAVQTSAVITVKTIGDTYE